MIAKIDLVHKKERTGIFGTGGIWGYIAPALSGVTIDGSRWDGRRACKHEWHSVWQYTHCI